HAGAREVRHRDERAGWELAVGKQRPADLDEAVAMARLLDEHRHRDEIRQGSPGAPQGLVHAREHAERLGLEVAGAALAIAVDKGGLTRQPDGAAALRDDRGGIRADLLTLAGFQMRPLHRASSSPWLV